MSDQSPETRLTALERRLAELEHDVRAYSQMTSELLLIVSRLNEMLDRSASGPQSQQKPLRRGSCTIIPFASIGNAQPVK